MSTFLLTIIIIMTIAFQTSLHELLKEKPQRELTGVAYVINLEPHSEECLSRPDLFTASDIRFRKIDRRTIIFSANFDLKKEAASPLKLQVTIEQLQQGSYIFYMDIPNNDVCIDIENIKDGFFASFAKQFDIYSCPMNARQYIVPNFTVDIGDVELGPQHVGRYRSKVLLSATLEGKIQEFFCRIFYTRVEREQNRH